jgi:hypothetical protein
MTGLFLETKCKDINKFDNLFSKLHSKLKVIETYEDEINKIHDQIIRENYSERQLKKIKNNTKFFLYKFSYGDTDKFIIKRQLIKTDSKHKNILLLAHLIYKNKQFKCINKQSYLNTNYIKTKNYTPINIHKYKSINFNNKQCACYTILPNQYLKLDSKYDIEHAWCENYRQEKQDITHKVDIYRNKIMTSNTICPKNFKSKIVVLVSNPIDNIQETNNSYNINNVNNVNNVNKYNINVKNEYFNLRDVFCDPIFVKDLPS